MRSPAAWALARESCAVCFQSGWEKPQKSVRTGVTIRPARLGIAEAGHEHDQLVVEHVVVDVVVIDQRVGDRLTCFHCHAVQVETEPGSRGGRSPSRQWSGSVLLDQSVILGFQRG